MWASPLERMPEVGKVVRCKVQNDHTKDTQEYDLIHVAESDQDWRTADDHSELSYNWTVIEWLDA